MAEEGHGVSLAILGIVAVLAVVGLVLLFTGATGQFVQPGIAKLYPGKVLAGETGQGFPYAGGAYIADQQGSCLPDEVFVESWPYDPALCRPGAERLELYVRHNKFFGAPEGYTTKKGWCCVLPEARSPSMD